jgi:hypothetical protein
LVRAKGGRRGSIVSKNNWVGPDGKVVCTDRTSISFYKAFGGTFVSYSVTIFASEGEVTFGDTKEGSMGIRTHPNLRLTNGKGVTTANGHALNSAGHKDKELWGKRAKWVDYWGEINGHTVGVAIFDYPDNLRHPTWWHARDYGLVAANPFGIHNFEGKKKGVGDFKLKKGEQQQFRYGILFHEGDAQAADISGSYTQWVEAVVAYKARAAEQTDKK